MERAASIDAIARNRTAAATAATACKSTGQFRHESAVRHAVQFGYVVVVSKRQVFKRQRLSAIAHTAQPLADG